MVWYAGNRNGSIGRLNPADGAVKTFLMPDAAARDPHTLVMAGNGAIWFTVQGGNFIGRLTPSTGKIDLVKVPTASARPYGIAVDSKGTPWVVLFGTNKLAQVDPQTLALKEFVLPREDARPRRIAITSDDRIWYADYMGGVLGVFDPRDGKFAERRMPSGANSRPYAMAVDERDRIWLVETGVQPNVIVGYDMRSEGFTAPTPIPSGGGVVRHMVFHAPSRALWFGTDAGTIGRATLD
jgi:virginiamycin B lyase